jgi:hypothetical protein
VSSFEFSIFHSKGRGLGQDPSNTIHMRVGVNFRRYLKYFKGSKLHIFMHIALHANENGECFPSYDLIEEDTEYGREAISNAVKALTEMVVEGRRVLVKWRPRNTKGQFEGSNRYIIFPTPEEVEQYEGFEQGELPEFGKSNFGKNQLSETEPEVVTSLKEVTKNKRNSQPIFLVPPSPSKGTDTTESEKGQKRRYFGMICYLLGYDHNLMTEKDRQIVGQLAKKIFAQKETYTLDVLSGFHEWWWQNEWRRERDIAPTIGNLFTELGKYVTSLSRTIEGVATVKKWDEGQDDTGTDYTNARFLND